MTFGGRGVEPLTSLSLAFTGSNENTVEPRFLAVVDSDQSERYLLQPILYT